MECKEVEVLLSEYIENGLPRDVHKKVSRHLEKCLPCGMLKEQMEELMYAFPELEEEAPFFLKNRLYYIPEAQDNIIELESKRNYLKWLAAVIGTFVLFLNLFYFTNILPPANRFLHSIVSEIETIAVKTEALYEKVKESKGVFFFSSLGGESDINGETGKDKENSMEKNIKKNGGKNG